MNEDGAFTISRSRYFEPNDEGIYCVGNKDECSYLLDDGATHVRWGRAPASPTQVIHLHLIPTPAQVRKPKPIPYLAELSRARLLSMPAPLLPTLSPASVPPELASLTLDLDHGFTDSGEQIPRWPDELVLPKLRALKFLGTYSSAGFWPKLGLEPRHVPNLGFLASDADDKGEVIDALAKFGGLRHVEVGGIRNHDRIFEVLPAELEALRLGQSRRKFSPAGIVRLRELVAVWLDAIKTEIDCALVCELPKLAELNLIGCKKLVNLEALLECPSLRRLWILDCNKPIRGALRERFEAHGFERLRIDFS